MHASNVLKVPAGKMIKIELDFDPDAHLINTVKITGDFFLYPEEILEQLESLLKNQKLDKLTLNTTIGDFLKKNKVELYGITPESLVDAILGCVGSE